MNRLTIAAAFALAAGSVPAHEEIRRADSHEHSVAQGRLAVESGELYLMLEIPGANLVGFEHPPRDEGERELLDDAMARLREGAWLVLPRKAECDPRIELETAGFAPRSGPSQNDHDHGAHDHSYDGHAEHDHGDHDHAHEHGDESNTAHDHGREHGAGHEHAEFGISVSAACRGGSPEWLELQLFDGWPDNRMIRLDAITESNQLRAELTADSPRIELR